MVFAWLSVGWLPSEMTERDAALSIDPYPILQPYSEHCPLSRLAAHSLNGVMAVKAWDTYSHQCLATYEGHRKAVWAMQVTNRTLITGSADGTVRFWDIETAQPLHVIDMVRLSISHRFIVYCSLRAGLQ